MGIIITNVDESMFQYLLLRAGIAGSTSLLAPVKFQDLDNDGNVDTEKELFLPCVSKNNDPYSQCSDGLRHLTPEEHGELLRAILPIPLNHVQLTQWKPLADASASLKNSLCPSEQKKHPCSVKEFHNAIMVFVRAIAKPHVDPKEKEIARKVMESIALQAQQKPLQAIALANAYISANDLPTAERLLKLVERTQELNHGHDKGHITIPVCLNCQDYLLATQIRLHDKKKDLGQWWDKLSEANQELAIIGWAMLFNYASLPTELASNYEFMTKLGETLSNTGKLEDARAVYTDFLRTNPKDNYLKSELKNIAEALAPKNDGIVKGTQQTRDQGGRGQATQRPVPTTDDGFFD